MLGDPDSALRRRAERHSGRRRKKVNNAIFYYARFEVPNPERLLRLQMTAQVHIQLAGVEQALVIPLAALGDQIADNRYHVSVLKQGKEEKREVAIGLRNNIDVQILSGLEAGDGDCQPRRRGGRLMAALLQLSGIRRSYRSGEQTVEVLKGSV